MVQRRVIIITGASCGLGSEIALCFGRAGERIVVNYLLHEQKARIVADEIARNGGESLCYRADVTSPADVDAMIKDTVERWGAVDVLINNAALTRDAIMLRMTEEDWDVVVDTNLTGPFQSIRSVTPHMIKQHSGHIINISSIVGFQGREGQANYASSKAGLFGLTRESAKELGPFNIKINAVLPGYMSAGLGNTVSETVRDRILKENTLGRAADPLEVANFIHHLSLMNNVSGQVFNLDSRKL